VTKRNKQVPFTKLKHLPAFSTLLYVNFARSPTDLDDRKSGAGDEIIQFISGVDFSESNEAPVDKSDRVKKDTCGVRSSREWLYT
jgi:hypothetical protein